MVRRGDYYGPEPRRLASYRPEESYGRGREGDSFHHASDVILIN